MTATVEFGDARLSERFWSKVEPVDSGCWEWTASKFPQGYAQFRGERAAVAHREAYLTLVGPVPQPLVLDHLCRVRHCVNPAHLEPVTQQTNILRGILPAVNVSRSNTDMCRNGLHPWTVENIKINATTGKQQCKPCLTKAYRKAGERKRVRRQEVDPGAGQGSGTSSD